MQLLVLRDARLSLSSSPQKERKPARPLTLRSGLVLAQAIACFDSALETTECAKMAS